MDIRTRINPLQHKTARSKTGYVAEGHRKGVKLAPVRMTNVTLLVIKSHELSQ